MRGSKTLTLTLLMLSWLCFIAAPAFAAVEDPGNSGPPHNDDGAAGNPSHDDNWARKDKPSNGNWGKGQHPNGPMSDDISTALWTIIFSVTVQ